MLVMSPWDQPTPITRSWCLWEIFSAMEALAGIEVVIPTSQRARLKDAITRDFNAVLAAIMGIDARAAQSFKAEDRDSIVQAIAGSVGFDVLNNRVRDHLRDRYVEACIRIGEEEVAGGRADASTAHLFNQIGIVARSFGQHGLAIE